MNEKDREMIKFLVDDGLNVNQISQRRKITVQAIYKTIRKLRKEGRILRLSNGNYSRGRGGMVVDGMGVYSFIKPDDHDYLRLHNVEIRFRIIKSDVIRLRRLILQNPEQYKVKMISHTGSIYFEYGIFTLMITKRQYLYGYFPADWELISSDLMGLSRQFDQEYRVQVASLESHFNLILWKKDRLSYEIINRHISLVNNGVSRRLREDKISNEVVSHDLKDGKLCYSFDLSKGFNEWEIPHPSKTEFYTHLAVEMMNGVRDMKMHKLLENSDKIADFFKDYNSFKEDIKVLKESSLFLLKNVYDQTKIAMSNEIGKDRVDYIG